VCVASFEEMEPIYPNHHHDASVDDAKQEEVYIPLEGSATLVAGEERFELRPGMMVRVGPEQLRRTEHAAGGERPGCRGAFGRRARFRRAHLTMPQESVRIAGASNIGALFAATPMEGRLDRIRLREGRANGQPALAAYAEDDDTGTYGAYGVMVFAIGGDKVVGITGFPDRPELFERLGFPVEIAA